LDNILPGGLFAQGAAGQNETRMGAVHALDYGGNADR
jgi:hypothetical protein